jgi:tRNA pseudouridine38-40 synthase
MSKEPQFPHGVCLCIAYDGTEFHGWQAQPGLRTVQAAVEEAASQMGLATTRVLACSRTDAGVHALGQLASLRSEIEVPAQGWIHGLNAVLPRDVVVLDAKPCFYRYNPRFHARSKRYRYLVRCGRYRDPLLRHRTWHLMPNYGRPGVRPRRDVVEDYLDVQAMRKAARHLIGTHDFNAFRAASDERETSERTMFSIRVLRGFYPTRSATSGMD